MKPLRPRNAYQKGCAVVRTIAKAEGLTVSGWLKTHPQDPCRRTFLKNKSGIVVGCGYCSPSGHWWMTRGTRPNAPAYVEGKENDDVPVTTPEHTILMTAATFNRHEKALALA